MRFPDDVPTLTDGTVTLRAPTLADATRVVEQCNDPESIEWTTVPTPYGRQDAEHFLGTEIPKGWSEETSLCFAVEHEELFAGSVALRLYGGGEGEVGYSLHPDARGRSVLRRALNLLLDWGFGELNLAVVHWRANAGNWASRRTAWAVGFTFGPAIPRLLEQRGERRDAWTAWIGADDPREPSVRWLEPPSFEARGLRLRRWRLDDAERIAEAANDPVLRRSLPGSSLPRKPEAVPEYLERTELMAAIGERLAWCVAEAETDIALGEVALFEFDSPVPGSARLGYWAHPDARGRGVITAAVRLAADWSLDTIAHDGLGLRRLFLRAGVSNTAARGVAERAGFTHVGTERACVPLPGGTYEDEAVYDRLRADSTTDEPE